MAILQHQFVYQGNAAEVPFSKICLNLEVPGFEYITTSDGDTTSFSRISNLGNHALKFFQALQSDNYSVDIPSRYLIGNDDKSVINFWKYLQSVSKDLDSLSFQADLLIKHESQVLKHDSIEAIYSLATSANEYKQIVAAERELNQGVSLNPAAVRRVTNEILKYARENLILVNKKVFVKVAEDFRQIRLNFENYKLLEIISHLTKIALSKPVLVEINQDEIRGFVRRFEFSDVQINNIIELIRANFEDLFDFPISVPEIVTIDIKGDIKFLSPTNETARKTDLINYDLFAEYTDRDAIQTRTIKYRWDNFTNEQIVDNTQTFDFFDNNGFVLLANQANSVTVTLRLFDNTVLQRQTFDGLDREGLGNIHFEVDLYKISQPENSTPPTPDGVDRKLKGKVLELSGKCSLKNLTVIVQAKERETDLIWKVVGSAITSNVGDFVMKYPGGVFAKAQALVSLTPDSPVDIPVFTDTAHVDAKQTISNEFLFLLLKDADCEPKDKTEKGDCECEPDDRIARLPSHEDLINSDKFSQDLGGGSCVNLTTPNRILSETVHYAIVRTSEPDVANYVLEKEVASDSTNPTDFNKNKTTFRLSDGQKIERQSVDFGNPIRWQDDPANNNSLTIYQAVQVAHGHLLTYKTAWKADGYSLGDMVYSLPLAPGQKKQIVINELKRTLEGSQQQILSQRESLSASIVNDRGIIDNLSGSIRESSRGRSSASTGGVSAGLGLGFIGPVSGILGVSGGFANSRSTASQDNARTVMQSFSEVLRNSITQSANSYRELNGTIIETVSESQQFSTTSEVVANHNHCHALTILYFEVLRHYAVYQELVQVEECIFVPLLMTNFTSENIFQWRDVLAENLLARPSSTYLTTLLGENPLLKAFDANERIKTNYSTVDYPVGAYDDEKISYLKGTLNLRVNFQRPKTKYDRIKSLPIVNRTITSEEFDFATLRKSVMVAAVTGGLSLLFGGANATKTDAEQIKVKAELFDQFMQMDANFETVPPAQCIRVRRFNSLSLNILGVSINISGEDFFENGTNDRTQWEAYARLLGYTGDVNSPAVFKMLDYYFKDRLISEWDDIFYKDILPVVFERILDGIGLENFALDLTPLSKYQGGERVIVVNLYGLTQNKRNELPLAINFTVANNDARILKDFITFIVENANLYYSTPHYNGILFGGYIGADLLDGATISIPESADEKRNPRIEDIFIVNELITHLNSNLEYYNKVLWYSLDPDRKYLLLDGFNIEVFNDLAGGIVNQSLASVVKNELIGIAGNSLIFPVAAGVNLDRRNIIIQQPDSEAENSSPTQSALDLFEHYKPLTPPPPYRISVPTRGVYAEALQGACNACEKVDPDTAQDWDKFKPDEPTAISPVTVGVPTPTAFNPQFKEFATPIVNIQNAPAAPAPGAGLAGLSELLGKSDIFKDITGLTENQKNAMQTYLSNQENAKAFAEVAKEMTMQGHNTAHADKIQDSINNSDLSDEVKAQLTKAHIQQMIDGGESKKAEAQNEKTTLTDAAVKAADRGKSVRATTSDGTGKSESVDIGASREDEKVLAEVTGVIPNLKQDNDNACWAFAATIMMSWKKQTTLPVVDVLKQADNGGSKYLDLYTAKQSLPSTFKEDFITNLNMIGEKPNEDPTLQQFIDWVRTYGPLWLTTDSDAAEGKFSPHARVLTKITGKGTPNGVGTNFVLIDPKTGKQETQFFNDFMKEFRQMVSDNASPNPFIKIVHFKDEIAGEGKSTAQEAAEIAQNWTTLKNLAINSCEIEIIDSLENQQWLNEVYNSKSKPIKHLGYVVGMALMYSRIYCMHKLDERYSKEIGTAPIEDSTNDTLNHYDLEFTDGRNGNPGLDITDHADGVATLRKVFTLLFGLGMQESEGKFGGGVNIDPGETRETKKAEVAEAGIFQMSWSLGLNRTDAKYKSIHDLYLLFQELQSQGSMLDIFKIGDNTILNPIPHRATKPQRERDNLPGIKFQELIFKNPAFSVVLAALGIRFRRTHWQPLKEKREAKLKRECYDMFKSIEKIMDDNSCCTGIGFVRTSYNAISEIETGLLATDVAITTDALWIVGKDRTDGNSKLARYDKSISVVQTGLATAFEGAKKVTIDNNQNPCIIDVNGKIFIAENNIFKQFTNELATDISIKSEGTIWIVGTGGEDANGFEIKAFNRSTSAWDLIAGKATKISIDKNDTPWVLNKKGELFSFDSIRWNKTNITQKVTDFSIGSQNKIWIIGKINDTTQNGSIFRLLKNGDFVSYDGSGIAVEIDLVTGLPYVINSDGVILKMK